MSRAEEVEQVIAAVREVGFYLSPQKAYQIRERVLRDRHPEESAWDWRLWIGLYLGGPNHGQEVPIGSRATRTIATYDTSTGLEHRYTSKMIFEPFRPRFDAEPIPRRIGAVHVYSGAKVHEVPAGFAF